MKVAFDKSYSRYNTRDVTFKKILDLLVGLSDPINCNSKIYITHDDFLSDSYYIYIYDI